MKNKILIFISILFLSSCETKNKDEIKANSVAFKLVYDDVNYATILIDSCEYIVLSPGSYGQSLSHKGNCKNKIHIYDK